MNRALLKPGRATQAALDNIVVGSALHPGSIEPVVSLTETEEASHRTALISLWVYSFLGSLLVVFHSRSSKMAQAQSFMPPS